MVAKTLNELRYDNRKPPGSVWLHFREEEGKGFPYMADVSQVSTRQFQRRGSIFNRRGTAVDNEVAAAAQVMRKMSIDARTGSGSGTDNTAASGNVIGAGVSSQGRRMSVSSGAAMMEAAAALGSGGFAGAFHSPLCSGRKHIETETLKHLGCTQ